VYVLQIVVNAISRDLILEDCNGHKMNAMKVFSESIKYLKDHFVEKIESVKHVVETDIHWVLTVPAIWKDNAKQFMREAAQQVFNVVDKVEILVKKNSTKYHNPD
jgi:isopropylmalate/homocitrate/citramalate synthase